MKNNISFIFIVPVVLAFSGLLGCDRNGGNSSTKLSVRFPQTTSSLSSSQALAQTKSEVGTFSDSDWSPIAPTGFSGTHPFNCFAIYVTGPEPDQKRNSCYRNDGTVIKEFGSWMGGFPSGSSGELEVTPGKNRSVGVFAFHATSGACQDFTGNKDIDKSLLSKPYFIGEVANLEFEPGKTLPVEVPISGNSQAWVDDCRGTDFGNGGNDGGNGGNPLAGYGTGADGDLVVSSGLADVRNIMSPSRGVPLITTTRVMALSPVGSDASFQNLTVKAMNLDTKFVVGDEVALYIAGATGITGCGPNLWPGFRTRGLVQSTSSGSATNMSVRIDDLRFAGLPAAQINAVSYGVGKDFCRLIISRVPNLNSLTFAPNTYLSYNAASFGDLRSDQDHEAGFMFIRVKNNVVVNGNAGIDVSARGFSGGTAPLANARDGQGLEGGNDQGTTNNANGIGGGGNFSSTNPGGGGNGGQGGNGYGSVISAGNTVGDQFGCGPNGYDPQMKCLFGKIFMGGGGGASYDAEGGFGGGIILFSARNLNVGAYQFKLLANGGDSYGGSTMGGGGGAGGSILASIYQIQSAIGGRLLMESVGGISRASSAKGGSGGGGRNHLNIVNGCAVQNGAVRLNSYGGPSTNATGGLNGGDGTNFISGNGAVACSSFVDMNLAPRVSKAVPETLLKGDTARFYGNNLGAVQTVTLQLSSNPSTTFNCPVTATNPSYFECNTNSVSMAGQYDLSVQTSTGKAVYVNSILTVNLP